jgi:hypothetical protein
MRRASRGGGLARMQCAQCVSVCTVCECVQRAARELAAGGPLSSLRLATGCSVVAANS